MCSVVIEYFNNWIYNLWICESQLELHIMKTNSEIEYILTTTLTVLFFVLPVVLTLNWLRHKMTISLTKIRLLFNCSLIPHLGLGLLLYLTFLVFGGNIFGSLSRTNWFEIISVATLWFYIIGVFCYIPSLIVLNLTVGLKNLIRKNKKPAGNNVYKK